MWPDVDDYDAIKMFIGWRYPNGIFSKVREELQVHLVRTSLTAVDMFAQYGLLACS